MFSQSILDYPSTGRSGLCDPVSGRDQSYWEPTVAFDTSQLFGLHHLQQDLGHSPFSSSFPDSSLDWSVHTVARGIFLKALMEVGLIPWLSPPSGDNSNPSILHSGPPQDLALVPTPPLTMLHPLRTILCAAVSSYLTDQSLRPSSSAPTPPPGSHCLLPPC